MGCYQDFYAEDDNGNALSFNVLFRLYNVNNEVYVPTPEIEPGTVSTMWLDEGTTYKVTPLNIDGWVNSGTLFFGACGSCITFVYTQRPPSNGFTIRTSLELATKTVLVAHVVKMPFIGLVGPDPDLWYWPQAFDYVGGKWYMTDPATKYRVEVGSVFETIPSFNKTYGTGSFADGIHCVVLAEGEGGVSTLIFKGDDVFQLHKDSPTEVNLSTTSNDVISETIMGPSCDLLGIPRGDECNSFWSDLYDPVFIANYTSLRTTGKDILGNTRELTWFDHIAFPFAIAGMVIPVPLGVAVSSGLGAASKLSKKLFTAATNTWVRDAIFRSPQKLLGDLDETISFSTAIVQIGKDAAEDVVRSLDAGDTSGAARKLQGYLDSLDIPDTNLPSYWSWTEFNAAMKAKIVDLYTYTNYIKSMKSYVPRARAAERAAAKAYPTADDLKVIADAALDPHVMEEVGKNVYNTVRTMGSITDPIARANKVKAIENVAENMPAAFDDVAKASIYDVSGYLIKHDVIENVLGKTTCSANYEMTTRLFKRLFDGVDEVALASTECNGIMAIAKEDPIAIAKALEDYTIKTDKERLLLSLGKSGTAGQEAAAWIASAKKNSDLSDVHRRFGTTVYNVVNDPSQIPMHGPSGVYRTTAIDAIEEAINSVPNYTDVRNMNKFIRETSATVRAQMIAEHTLSLINKAQAKDTRGIADIFRSAGVDTIQSDLIADQLWNVSHRIDVLGDAIDANDLTTLTDRMVEANVVEGSKLVEDMINRIVKNGTITDVELKSFFDVANHNPVEVALAMEKIPAGALASFQNVLSAKGKKGKILQGLMDTRNNIRSKFGAIGDTLLSSWARTTPVGLRLGRTPGDGFGSGVFKSLSVHSRLLEWAGDHWKALVAVLGVTGAAKFVTYWFAFEWQPFHAVLRRADVMEPRAAEKYTDVMYSAANDMGDLDWNVDKLSVRESVYNSTGILCELLDYAGKNPIPSGKLATMKETFDLYIGTSSGIVGNSLYVDIQKDLRQLLIKYNEQFLECIDANMCTSGDECITGEMAYNQRETSTDKLSNAESYQIIIDTAWKCVPGSGTVGTIRCTSNQTGFAVYLDEQYIDHSYGNTWLVIPNVPIGSHTVKIDKGSRYDPEFCEKTVFIVAGEIKTVDCQMTKTEEGGGTIKCTSNQTSFAVHIDDVYIDQSYGNSYLVVENVSIGERVVKIEKGAGYTPPHCEETVDVIEGKITTFDCQMTQIGTCSRVTDVIIAFAPKLPIEDEIVAFSGFASSDDPLTTWEWDFGDGFTATGQALTHKYRSAGIYAVELKVTNDCEESASITRNITVSEEEIGEFGTLHVSKPINAVNKVECTRAWDAIIHVDGQTIGKKTPFSIPFGTDTYMGGYGGPCGTHTITIILAGYDSVSKSITIDNEDSKSWQPEMFIEGTAPKIGVLTLRSNQTGFDGYIDGVHVGNSGNNTRIVVVDVEQRVHLVKISKGAGYSPEYCEQSVLVEKRSTFICDMQPIATHNIDLIVPKGAMLFIDEKYIGETTIGRLTTILRGLQNK